MGETEPTIQSYIPSPGDQIREYEILEMIGKGGMATVYKARHKLINQLVALKILKQSLTSDIQFCERFMREAQTQAQLTGHKNIVTIHNFIIERGLYIIIMEYVDGIGVSDQKIRTLSEQLRHFGALDAWHFKPILEGVAAGLDFAHEQDIIHRDIKPSNIMFTNRGIAKVADFGIAQIVVEQRLTRTGVAVGTPKYMSPEQVRGKKLDARSDIYSLGIMIYESLTGVVPFDGDTDYEIMRKHEEEEPKPPREMNPRIPEAYDKMIMKCIAKDPEQRPQNLKAVLQILETPQVVKKIPEKVLDESVSAKSAPEPAETIAPFEINWEDEKKPVLLWLVLGIVGFCAILATGYYFLIYNPKSAVLHSIKLPGLTSESTLLKKSLVEKFNAIGNLIAHLPHIADAVITRDESQLTDMISEMCKNEPELTYVHFTDKNSTVIASSTPAIIGETYFPVSTLSDSNRISEKDGTYNCRFNIKVAEKDVGAFLFGAVSAKSPKIKNEQDLLVTKFSSVGNLIVHSAHVANAIKRNEEWKLQEIITTLKNDETGIVYAHFVNKKNMIIASSTASSTGKFYNSDLVITDSGTINDKNGSFNCGFNIMSNNKKVGTFYFGVRASSE